MNTATEALFAPLAIAAAPDSSKLILEQIQKSYRFIPNLMAFVANSPTAMQGYLTLDAIWEDGSFPPIARELILLTAIVESECDDCVAVHSSVAKNAFHIPAQIIQKLNALIALVKELFASAATLARLAFRTSSPSDTEKSRSWNFCLPSR
jgi:alkylhydroperoxidase/carboxymuconolactone decarboxylase family protein YurZ